MKGKTVYVVHNVHLLGQTFHAVFEDEVEALKEAAKPYLGQGVLRRSVTPTVVK